MSAILTDNSLLTAALDLAGHGMHVFPLAPDAKTPALRHDWEGRATTDAARIERCWRTGAFNIGVACGPSRLYVLDLDTPKDDTPPPAPPFDEPGITTAADALAHLAVLNAELYPCDTMTVRTGRGGEHLLLPPARGRGAAQHRGQAGLPDRHPRRGRVRGRSRLGRVRQALPGNVSRRAGAASRVDQTPDRPA